MTPLVSILIPAYNAERWLADTLRSALAQTWRHREIIVVDDGSTDRTLAIARAFASRELQAVTQPNQGAAAARNHALELCQGEYVQWLDADDLLAPDKIRQQLFALQQRGTRRTLATSAWGSFSYSVARARPCPSALWQDLRPAEWLFTKLEQNVFMMNASWLVSRELTRAAGPWDPQLSLDDDGEYFGRVLLASDRVLFTRMLGCYYRKTGFNSLSQVDHSDRKLESLCLSLRRHTQYMRWLEDTPRTRAACVEYLQRWLVYFFPDRSDLMAQLSALATELGGRLQPPQLRVKYAWLERILGWRLASRAQSLAPQLKHGCLRQADRVLYLWDRMRGSLAAGRAPADGAI